MGNSQKTVREEAVAFGKVGGHNHDGINSTKIDFSNYTRDELETLAELLADVLNSTEPGASEAIKEGAGGAQVGKTHIVDSMNYVLNVESSTGYEFDLYERVYIDLTWDPPFKYDPTDNNYFQTYYWDPYYPTYISGDVYEYEVALVPVADETASPDLRFRTKNTSIRVPDVKAGTEYRYYIWAINSLNIESLYQTGTITSSATTSKVIVRGSFNAVGDDLLDGAGVFDEASKVSAWSSDIGGAVWQFYDESTEDVSVQGWSVQTNGSIAATSNPEYLMEQAPGSLIITSDASGGDARSGTDGAPNYGVAANDTDEFSLTATVKLLDSPNTVILKAQMFNSSGTLLGTESYESDTLDAGVFYSIRLGPFVPVAGTAFIRMRIEFGTAINGDELSVGYAAVQKSSGIVSLTHSSDYMIATSSGTYDFTSNNPEISLFHYPSGVNGDESNIIPVTAGEYVFLQGEFQIDETIAIEPFRALIPAVFFYDSDDNFLQMLHGGLSFTGTPSEWTPLYSTFLVPEGAVSMRIAFAWLCLDTSKKVRLKNVYVRLGSTVGAAVVTAGAEGYPKVELRSGGNEPGDSTPKVVFDVLPGTGSSAKITAYPDRAAPAATTIRNSNHGLVMRGPASDDFPRSALFRLISGGSGFNNGPLWIPGAYPPGFRAYRSTTGAIGNNTWTQFNFDAESWDNFGSMFTNTGGVFTCPRGLSGHWLVGFQVQWATNSTGSRRIRRNGTHVSGSVVQSNVRASTSTTVSETVDFIDLRAGETLYFEILQDSGGNLNLNEARMWGVYFGGFNDS